MHTQRLTYDMHIHIILPKTCTYTPSYLRHAHAHHLTQKTHIHTVLHKTHTHRLTRDTHHLTRYSHIHSVLHTYTPSYTRHTHTVLPLAGKRPVADLHRKATEGAQS